MEMGMEGGGDYGAFNEKFELLPQSQQQLPLHGLTFAVKDIFDISGRATGFGNPDWATTHAPAAVTSPVVLATLAAGATNISKTVMDEMAYSRSSPWPHYRRCGQVTVCAQEARAGAGEQQAPSSSRNSDSSRQTIGHSSATSDKPMPSFLHPTARTLGEVLGYLLPIVADLGSGLPMDWFRLEMPFQWRKCLILLGGFPETSLHYLV